MFIITYDSRAWELCDYYFIKANKKEEYSFFNMDFINKHIVYSKRDVIFQKLIDEIII